MIATGLSSGINSLQVIILSVCSFMLLFMLRRHPASIFILIPATATILLLTFFIQPEILFTLSEQVQTLILAIIDYIKIQTPFDYSATRQIWLISAIGISIYTFILIERGTNLLPLIVPTVSIMGVYWYSGYSDAWLLTGILMGAIWYYSGSALAEKALHEKGLQDETADRAWHHNIIVNGLAIAIISLVLPSIPEHNAINQAVRDIFLDNSSVVSTAQSIVQLDEGQSPALFNLSESGFQPEETRLGGPVVLDNSPVMTVKSPVPLYLAGAVKTRYEDNNWLYTDLPRNPHDFNRRLPAASDITETIEIEIELSGITAYNIFTPHQLVSLHSDRHAYFSFDADDNYIFPNPTSRRERYTLQAAIRENSSPEPADPIPSLSAVERQRTLEVPAWLPDRVLQLAADISRNLDDPFQKALSVQTFLSNNYTYNLDVPFVPEGREFVDFFLFDSKEGYCTYYASAMVLMLRALGIPARYVEGYLAKESSQKNKYLVRQSDAHAWAEAYIEPHGWLIFEATPVYTDFKESLPQILAAYENQQVLAASSRKIPLLGIILRTAGLITILILAAGMAFLLWRIINNFIKLSKLRQKLKTMRLEEAYTFNYRKLLKLLALHGVPVHSGETLEEYASRINTTYCYENIYFADLTKNYESVFYGNKNLEPAYSELLIRFLENLNASVLVHLGFARYWWKILVLGQL